MQEDVTILTGQNLAGSVLGKITVGAAAAARRRRRVTAYSARSTGANAKPGVYRVTCIAPAANAGKFTVEDPDGIEVGVATVAVAFAGPINFTIADGAADFVAGDAFNVTVAASTGKYKLAVARPPTAPEGVRDRAATDASAADKEASVYVTGEFARQARLRCRALGGDVAADLAALNIYLRDVVAATESPWTRTTAELMALLPGCGSRRAICSTPSSTVHERDRRDSLRHARREKRITRSCTRRAPARSSGPGLQDQHLQPAYAKDKRIFRPDAALKRIAGEKIGGALWPSSGLTRTSSSRWTIAEC